MAQHRGWDESRSPQWKYLLQKESAQRRKTRKDIEIERARKQLEQDTTPTHVSRKRIRTKSDKIVKVGKEELQRKLQNQKYNNNDSRSITQLFTEPKE